MKKKILLGLTVLVCVLIGIIAGPRILASVGTEKIDLADFINEDGEFAYPDVAWDISLSELEEVLGHHFQEPIPELSTVSGFQATYQKEFISIMGCRAQVYFTFTGDKLNQVDIKFFDAMSPSLNRDNLGNNLNRLAPKLLEELTRLYEADFQPPPAASANETVRQTRPIGAPASGAAWLRDSTEEWMATRMGMYSWKNDKGDVSEVTITLYKFRR